MNSIVIYASHFGNTRTIAQAIADELKASGNVQLLRVEDMPGTLPPGTDLVVIGGPTEGHRMTEPMAAFFGRLAPGVLASIAAAGFDTRLRWPRWLSGSAGHGITEKLEEAGARVIVEPESFFVKNAGTTEHSNVELDAGEAERATLWARTLAHRLAEVPVKA